MNSFSQADLRAQAAPERCRRCHHVDAFRAGEEPHRFTCRKHQVMQEHCAFFVAIPQGHEAVASIYNAPSSEV